MPRKPIPGAPSIDPWKPVAYEIEDAGAIQALARGNASEAQQQRALRYVIEVLAGTYDQSYRPGKADDTVFAEGRRFVGLQLVKLTKLNLSKLTGKPAEQS